ncbi:MAG: hypothetical protein ACO4A3_08835, partial [Ilumatobacteraceae bacterium]
FLSVLARKLLPIMPGTTITGMTFLPLLNFEWVVCPVFELEAGVKGGRSLAQRTLDAGFQRVRWPLWPMGQDDASAITNRSDSYA